MKRYNYQVNGLFHTSASLQLLKPAFFYEVAPGETWGGNIDVKALTNPTSDLVLNRLFYYLNIFYVPYRIAWDEFPSFVTGRTTGMEGDSTVATEVPVVTTTNHNDVIQTQFWAHQPQFTSTNPAVNALPFRVYNTIYNTYFRYRGDSVVTLNSTSVQTAAYKGNDYFQRLVLQDLLR